MKRHTFHSMGVAFAALSFALCFLHTGSAGAGTVGPIIPKFDATCGGQTWSSVTQPSGGTARLIAQGQMIHFEDDSEDYDASQVMDGQGQAVEDHIDTHTWWYTEVGGQYGDPIGTASSLDWTPPASGKIYIIKKKSDDQTPVVTEDAAAYCYMKLDVRDVDYVTVTPDPGYVAVGGGTLVLTGHAWDDNGTPGNTADDVELAATFNWTVDPALGTLAPASGKQSTLTAGANPGTCTVTATHQPSSKAGSATVQVLKVEITEPDENPVTDNNFTFNMANPGVCNVTATGTSGVQTENADLEWTIQAINGSVLTSNPAPPKGANVTFTYTTLPATTGDFGERTVTLTHPEVPGSQDQQVVQIFFNGADNATNHPGAGAGTSPNWFFYWLQTSAGFGAPEYDNVWPETRWQNNAWVAIVGPMANGNYTPPAGGDNGGNQLNGIDTFAFVCRHEGRHVQTLTVWYPNGYNGTIDAADGDYLPDAQEPALGGTQQNPINGGPFVAGTSDTDGDQMIDVEDYTVATQQAWTEGAADDEDWADPGHQSTQ